MKIEILISVIGTFGTVGLAINAFFLRGIFLDLNDVKIKLAQISAHGEAKELRLQNLEKDTREVFKRLNLIEREVSK